MNDLSVRFLSQAFIRLQKLGEIFPSSGRCKDSSHGRLHAIEIISADLQICKDCRMDICLICVFFPDIIVHIHIDLLDAVKCHHIKIANRLIIFRRIACRHDDPAFRDLLIAEHLTLQELQHRRCQRLGYTVNLIDKKNPFF